MAALSPDDQSNLLNEIAKIGEYESDKESDVVGEIENLLDETQKPDPQSCLLAPPPPPSPPTERRATSPRRFDARLAGSARPGLMLYVYLADCSLVCLGFEFGH